MSSPEEIVRALQRLEVNLVERLTSELDRRFDAFGLGMNGRFDAIEVRLERLETEYQVIVAGLRRIEERLGGDTADRARLRAEVSDLKEKVTRLDARVRELESRLSDD